MNDDVDRRASGARTWRWIALLLSASQLVTPVIVTAMYGDFLSTGVTSDALITPAGYAFSIWGLITTLTTVTCAGVVWKGLNSPWEARLLAEAAVVFVGFSGWLVLAAQNWLWLTVVVFAVMVAVLLDIARLLILHAEDLHTPTWLRRLTTFSVGLYLGWSSIAVCVNVAAALIDSGWSPTETPWQAVVLMVATGVALGITVYLRATPGYIVAAIWALVAASIGAAQADATILAAASAAAVALVLISGGAVAFRHAPILARPRRQVERHAPLRNPS